MCWQGRYTLITSPDLLLGKSGEHKIFVGAVYEMEEKEAMSHLAQRFRTTVKSILAFNPDLSDPAAVNKGQQVCLAPCSADTVDFMLPDQVMKV